MALIQVSEIWQFTQIDGFDHISLWKMVINAANIVLYWDLTMKHVFFAYGFTMNNSGIVGLQWGYHGDIMGRWSIPFGDSTLWQMAHRIRWSTYLESTFCIVYSRRKFRSQTSDNMDRWKAEQGRGRERRKIRRKKSRRERVRRKKMQMREKVAKSRNTVFFQWFVAPGGRKVGSLKRRVRSQLARWEMKNCTPLWREAHSKSICTKHLSVGPLLEVAMSKKCAPLWREAHFQVKMYKTPQLRTTFGSWDVEKVHAVVARSTCRSQNVQSTPWSDHFWKFRCRKSARCCGAKHISKSKC